MVRNKASIAVVLALIALTTIATGSLAKQVDPELKQCRHQCLHQQQFSEQQKRQCEDRCEDYYRQKQEHAHGGETTDPSTAGQSKQLRECQQQCERQAGPAKQKQVCSQQCAEKFREREKEQEHAHGGERTEPSTGGQKQLRECQKQCERQAGPAKQKQVCSQQCAEKFKEREKEQQQGRKQEEGKGKGNPWREEEEEWRGREQEEWRGREQEQEEEEGYPYVFEQHHFRSKVVETEHGRVSFLPKFTKRSKFLRGLENFRFGLLEADPQTFIVPSHVDADAFLFIASGRGTITMIQENKRRSTNVKQGDIFRVPAGTPVYVTNRDENDKLYIVKLLQPVNSPGEFEIYNGAGGQNPESFYNAFSWDLLEAAFQTERSELERLFGQQQQGAIVKASREQIEALSGGGDSDDSNDDASIWPFGETKGSKKGKGGSSGSRFKYNLFDKNPSFSNQHGQLFIVDKDDFKQLKDFDLAISFANITKGSMLGPLFNSKSTKISIVLDGEGYIEMACPHLAKQQQQPRRWSTRQSPYETRQSPYETRQSPYETRQSPYETRQSPYETRQSPYETRQQGQQPRRRGQQGRWSHHQGRGQEQEQTSFQQVRARLSQGTVFITPAGHPAAVVASRDSNLQIVCFEVNAENNVKYPLTGKNNIVGLMEKEAQELAFNLPSRDVERIFKSQNEQFFFPGPKRQQGGGGRGYADE